MSPAAARAHDLKKRYDTLSAAYDLHPTEDMGAELVRTYNAMVRAIGEATGRRFDTGNSAAYRGLDPARIASVA